MSGVMYDYVENYIRSLIPCHTGILKELEDYAKIKSIPIVQKETAKFLELMVNIKNPNSILELGTAIGYSAILMEFSSNMKSKITTIDRDEEMVKIARSNIERCCIEDNINVVCGDCLETLKKIDDTYDLIFLDAGKGHYNQILPECLRVLKDDGIIIADNVLFRGMVASSQLVKRRKITIVKRMRNYLEIVSDGDKFITSLIPMGDGIAVTRRNNNNET